MIFREQIAIFSQAGAVARKCDLKKLSAKVKERWIWSRYVRKWLSSRKRQRLNRLITSSSQFHLIKFDRSIEWISIEAFLFCRSRSFSVHSVALEHADETISFYFSSVWLVSSCKRFFKRIIFTLFQL